MTERQPIALWFGQGLENALAARAVLGGLQAEHPNAQWVLLGPQGSLYLFEMDPRVTAYIPLQELSTDRNSQSWFSRYLAARTQRKQIQQLGFGRCFGLGVHGSGLDAAAKQFTKFTAGIQVPGTWLQKPLGEFLKADRPLLQAGPQALAFATRLHRTSPPHLPKWLVLLVCNDSSLLKFEQALQDQWAAAQQQLGVAGPVHLTVAVVNPASNRLLARWLNDHRPGWLQTDLSQAMGLLAYSDRVICASPEISLICGEMGRADRLLLDKNHS